MNKRRFFYFILLIPLILLGYNIFNTTALHNVLHGYDIFTNIAIHNTTETTQKKNPNLLTYQNTELGYSFKYPSSWTPLSNAEVKEKTGDDYDPYSLIIVNKNSIDEFYTYNNHKIFKEFISLFLMPIPEQEDVSPEKFLEGLVNVMKNDGKSKIIYSKTFHKSGLSGIDIVYDIDEEDSPIPRARNRLVWFFNSKNSKKAFFLVFGTARDRFQEINNSVVDIIVNSLEIQ